MMNKIRVGILGATGVVGQNYLRLLNNHPFFETTYLAASSNSAGGTYQEAIQNRWQMTTSIPESIKDLVVYDANILETAIGKADLLFSCLEMDKKSIMSLENKYASRGFVVVSNASAHRFTQDVPMLIPEVNFEHLKIIESQQKNNNFSKGFVVVKPNCSIQSYLTPVYALIEAGFEIKNIMVTTMQAVSGAGYPGVSSLDMVDNIVPYINGEEEKTQKEPLKILGRIDGASIVLNETIKISAHCNRVPVIDGHTACVNIQFGSKKPTQSEILNIWNNFISLPQKLNLPFAPKQPIIYNTESNRPQPRKDRDNDKAMAVTIGQLRPCSIFDYKFVSLSHNTVRGAAGGGILIAELLANQGII